MPPRKAQAEDFKPTKREWDAAVKRQRHMKVATLEIARLVLMERLAQADVAKRKRKSRTWVGKVVARMVEDIRAHAGTLGWTTESVTLPPEDWVRVRAIEREARAKASRQHQTSANDA